ncbi:MAG: MFS transporter [Luteibacter sp.]|uniref:MFS transporter n=1 Tax=Luteibacter TaxID=242605 RepID=UPI00055AE9F6|nr:MULTISPECIES: MFS transporter [unclassified Luteibacter]MDQ7994289.1 MFS transporter [Luteibacter sp.]MDQ8048589.1 MFS transporter [Luteibacter sp.]MDR6642217.1 1-acyl-sn-glycerol-3-phosphate acyltransferase [Luteibacter sp. 1214]
MSQFSLLATRRFAPFFWTQALGAFNDNAFRNAMVMLVAFQMSLPDAEVSLYTNLAPALFILPYFLFSATAGQLAEKFEKTRIIRYVKLFEIAAMTIAAVGFFTHHVSLLLVVLFLMGIHSTVFGPIKYSILPQTLDRSELVGGNALVEMGTQLAMLIGMIVGNSLMLIAGYGTLAASLTTIAIAVTGYLVSRSVPPAPATAPDLKFNWNPLSETWRVLKITNADRAVFNAVLGISWFWFFGTVMIAQLPNYTRHILGGDGSVNTLVLTLFSLGTGVGSLMCERLSGKRVEIGLVPMGAFGLTVFAVDLFFARPGVTPGASLDWLAFLAVPGAWRAALDLTMIGAFAGFYVVPLFAFVQSRAPRDRLSRVIAGNNIVNALFICAASGFGIGLTALGLSVPTIFLVTGLINIAVAVYIFTLVPEFMMRFITWVLVHTLYRVRVDGLKNVPDEGAALVVCNHVSFMDPLILMASVRRPMRFVMYYKIFNIPVLRFVFRTAKAIPIAGRNEDVALMDKAFDEIDEALAAGEVVCIFPEGGLTRDGDIQTFRPGVDRILARRPVPVVPLALRGMWGSIFSRRDGALRRARLPRRFWSKIELVGGAPLPAEAANAASLEARVSELRGDKA